ncbi:MAG TPA: PP2C family protein-serine/threonine phosphatase [Thermoleophilia bacterium]|nr:PP2C family protein-serine/threonine phosphatase [Thermoleophilia bacterium]
MWRPLQRRLIATGGRIGRHRVAVGLLASGLEVLFLATLGRGALGFPSGNMLITGAITALIAWVAAAVAGPKVGLATAAAAGAAYLVFVTDLSNWGQVEAALASSLILLLAAYVTGRAADALRAQAASRERLLGERLDRALWERTLLDRLLVATPGLQEHATEEAVATEVCRRVIEDLGCDGATLLVRDDGGYRSVGALPPLPPAAAGLHYERDPAISEDVGEAGAPYFIDDLRGRRLSRGARRLTRALHATSALVCLLPQPAGGVCLVLYWYYAVDEPPAEVRLIAQRLLEQAALAVSRVRQQRARHEAHELQAGLQQALLPRLAVAGPPIRVATFYLAGEHRLLLGGDFLDAVELPDGDLRLIIGDVSGHGPRAAAIGATMRASWRAVTLSGASLETVMDTLDAVFLAERRSTADFATLCMATISPRRTLRLLSAGHPPPMLATEGARDIGVRPFLPLGIVRRQAWAETTYELPAGWRLLFYTDGLLEGRASPGADERLGPDRVRSLVLHLPDLGRSDLDALAGQVAAANGGPLSDDVALLAVSEADCR